MTLLVRATGVRMEPSWSSGGRHSWQNALMRLWAGKPLLRSKDPVGVAVGLSWVASAFEECGVNFSLADGEQALARLAKRLGPPRGDVDDWLCRLAGVRTLDLIDQFEQLPGADGRDDAFYGVGCGLARALRLVGAGPDGAALSQIRAARGLDVAHAAREVGWSVEAWERVEWGACLEPHKWQDVDDAFALTCLQRGAISDGEPIPVDVGGPWCPWHGEKLEFSDEPIWHLYEDSPENGWLRGGGACMAECPFGGCGRGFGVGVRHLFLLPPDQLDAASFHDLESLGRYLEISGML